MIKCSFKYKKYIYQYKCLHIILQENFSNYTFYVFNVSHFKHVKEFYISLNFWAEVSVEKRYLKSISLKHCSKKFN